MEKFFPLFKPIKTIFYVNFSEHGAILFGSARFEGIITHSKPFEMRLKGFDQFGWVQTGVPCCAAQLLL
jgi:hypothetical protein